MKHVELCFFPDLTRSPNVPSYTSEYSHICILLKILITFSETPKQLHAGQVFKKYIKTLQFNIYKLNKL